MQETIDTTVPVRPLHPSLHPRKSSLIGQRLTSLYDTSFVDERGTTLSLSLSLSLSHTQGH